MKHHKRPWESWLPGLADAILARTLRERVCRDAKFALLSAFLGNLRSDRSIAVEKDGRLGHFPGSQKIL